MKIEELEKVQNIEKRIKDTISSYYKSSVEHGDLVINQYVLWLESLDKSPKKDQISKMIADLKQSILKNAPEKSKLDQYTKLIGESLTRSNEQQSQYTEKLAGYTQAKNSIPFPPKSVIEQYSKLIEESLNKPKEKHDLLSKLIKEVSEKISKEPEVKRKLLNQEIAKVKLLNEQFENFYKIRSTRNELTKLAQAQLESIQKKSEIELFRNSFLSQKGAVQNLLKTLQETSKEWKKPIGNELNILKKSLTADFDNAVVRYDEKTKDENISHVDLTMPTRPLSVSEPGHEHPLTKTLDEMVEIFVNMGFDVAYGPEIEDDEHNFEKLNFAPDHPARDMQDTFFIKPSKDWKPESGEKPVLLRTHTSPVQVRLMEAGKLPIRAVMPGRVYRNEAVSARSAACFFQLEGLVIDKGVSMADLKGILLSFAKQFYGEDSKIRLRPSYFPFTEPSVEVDVSCYICGGKGCRICKHSGWLEVLGAGMVHPNVLKACGIDPEIYSGYAFGMGIDRTALMRYGINDIRLFTENDYRFLRQF